MVRRAAIESFCRAVAKQFRPRAIFLFGSYASGHPTANADLDLLIRAPKRIAQGLRWRDAFVREVVEKGKRMYEAVSSAKLFFGLGAASRDEFITGIVNSNIGHAAERAVDRAGFDSVQQGREALQEFARKIETAGVLPENAIADPAHPDRIIIPGFGENGAVVYQRMKNGKLRLKTVLKWRP